MTTAVAFKPHGSKAVAEALVDAATELFAARGPAAVSIREVAARAGVNHGLVHRHFGSKQALLAAVVEKLTWELAAETTNVPRRGRIGARAFRATQRQGAYWRILAHTLLEGQNLAEVQRNFPVMARLIAAAERGQMAGRFDAKLDPRAIAAVGVSLSLGWLLFEPFLLAATGLEQEAPRRRHRQLAAVWRRLERSLRPRAG
jgi:AcrR family transcriptional regulator